MIFGYVKLVHVLKKIDFAIKRKIVQMEVMKVIFVIVTYVNLMKLVVELVNVLRKPRLRKYVYISYLID